MSCERLREARCSQPQHLSWTLSTNASKRLWLDQKVHNVLKTQQGVCCSVKVKEACLWPEGELLQTTQVGKCFKKHTFSHEAMPRLNVNFIYSGLSYISKMVKLLKWLKSLCWHQLIYKIFIVYLKTETLSFSNLINSSSFNLDEHSNISKILPVP